MHVGSHYCAFYGISIKYPHLQAKEQLERSGSHRTVTIHYIIIGHLLPIGAFVVLFCLSLTHLEVLEEKTLREYLQL